MTGKPSTLRVASSLGCCHDFDIREGHAFPGYNRISTAAAAWSRLPGLVVLVPGGRSSCNFTSSRKERQVQVSSLGARGAAGVASILGVSPLHPLFPLSCGVALRLSPGLLPAPTAGAA